MISNTIVEDDVRKIPVKKSKRSKKTQDNVKVIEDDVKSVAVKSKKSTKKIITVNEDEPNLKKTKKNNVN